MISVIYICLITFLGYIFIDYIAKTLSSIEKITLGFGFSIFVSTIFGYSSLLLGRSINFSVMLFSILILIFFALPGILKYIFKTQTKKVNMHFLNTFNFLVKGSLQRNIFFIGGVVLFLVIILMFYDAIFWPISAWDALTLYDFRGILLSQGRTIADLEILGKTDPYNVGYYLSYPLLTSITHAYIYLLKGKTPQVIYPTFYLFFILFFYSNLKKYTSKLYSFLATFLLAINSKIIALSIIPYTNVPYLFYYFISSLMLVQAFYNKEKINKSYLFLSLVFLLASMWVRMVEPFYLVNIIVLITLLAKTKHRENWLYIPIFAISIFMFKWLWTRVAALSPNDFFVNNTQISIYYELLNRFNLNMIKRATFSLITFFNNNIQVVLIFVINLIISYKNKSEIGWNLTFLYMLDLLLLIFGTYIIGLIFGQRTEIFDSIGRTGIFIYPFSFYILGLYQPFRAVSLYKNGKNYKK